MQPPRIRVRASSSPTPRHTSQMSLPTFDYLLPSFLSFRIRSHSRILRVAHLSSPPSFPSVPPVNAPLQSAPFGFTLSFLHPSLPSPARESGLKKRKRKTAESAPRTGFPRDTNTHDTRFRVLQRLRYEDWIFERKIREPVYFSTDIE